MVNSEFDEHLVFVFFVSFFVFKTRSSEDTRRFGGSCGLYMKKKVVSLF